ncbi:endonuclease/exonuclease/phosphatase family protein [Bacteroides sp. ET71]|uniref:endonuclease/exonuclease/phosphatase family protein n=1 Tax=Bacteroides sp. ET71 TaxID=2939421 RepID=UPI00201392FF|nr:endonuclease/exonuclease/phosphatase family protein [Bacteroides sp. ET71]MCL1615419.1 endonuclease/exonuclease/phosphatase family protein [Bacteroides sp. ET71]
MKTFFLTLASALLLLSSCGTKTSDAPQSVNVMTFNIRLDTESDSLNAWPHRRAEVGRMLGYYAPDLLGMQEVLPQQMTALKEMLPQYTALGVGREDGKAEGEFSPIFFRTDRFELLRSGNFSLSPTPNEFGVKGWGAACNRICTWALLKDRQNGREVAYFNTHLDHVSAEARREGMRLIVDSLKAIAPAMPAIVTGDFNCLPDDEPAQVLTQGGLQNAWTSADVTCGPSWSFHDFGRLPRAERYLIDFVFATPQLHAARCRVLSDVPTTGYYSDHCPVMAELTFTNPQ